jgi:signal transduction histidine kinase
MNFLFLNRFFGVIIGIGLLIVLGTLYYSNQLVKQLALEEEKRIRLYAEILKYIANAENSETDFLFNHIIKMDSSKVPVINVPAIIVNEKGEPIGDNLNLPENLSPETKKNILLKELSYIKSFQFEPIPIEYVKGKFNYIYYRESDNLIRLRNYPYVTFSLLFAFIVILFVLFYIAKRNEQNMVWAGMAKETAHQLGTPISGLIAWIEILKSNKQEDVQMAVQEMEKDVNRLVKVSERFSKIGSVPELSSQPILPVLQSVVSYLQARFHNHGKIKIQLQTQILADLVISFNKILLEWVLENLIKNAIDAFEKGEGTIIIQAFVDNHHFIVDVTDNGKGIEPQNKKYVFKPGFSTKKRGWGLGLSLAKRIIENYHQGKIFILHTELGKGTTFRIILPLKAQ